MSTALLTTAAIRGVTARLVSVTIEITPGSPFFSVTGLSAAAARELQVRTRAAIQVSGKAWPDGHIDVSFGGQVDSSTAYDLVVALGVLVASGQLEPYAVEGRVPYAELGLDGALRPVRGVLSAAETGMAAGLRLVVAKDNEREARLVCAVDVARHLSDFWGTSGPGIGTLTPDTIPLVPASPDFADIVGQPLARRAAEIAAVGGHHMLLVGPPSAGKTMLARRMTGILPPMSVPEALDVTRIQSAAGLTWGMGIVSTRPFRAPHHSTTTAGLVGGGMAPPRPGEVSLAHHGVLFLDEVGEFRRESLEYLREPLAAGKVELSRASGVVEYPAGALVVASTNPCPCGHRNGPLGSAPRCCCSAADVEFYEKRIASFVHHVIDMRVDLPRVDLALLGDNLDVGPRGEKSADIQARVVKARARIAALPAFVVGDLLTSEARALLGRAYAGLGLSKRRIDRTAHVALSIAALSPYLVDGAETIYIDTTHVAEALQFAPRDVEVAA